MKRISFNVDFEAGTIVFNKLDGRPLIIWGYQIDHDNCVLYTCVNNNGDTKNFARMELTSDKTECLNF